MQHSILGLGIRFLPTCLLAVMYLLLAGHAHGQSSDSDPTTEAADPVLASLPSTVRQLAERQRERLLGKPSPRSVTSVTLRVGSGCTYSSVQDAIDAASNSASTITVIRLRTAIYTEAINIGSKNIEIIGGHANCTTTTPDDTSTIRNPSGNNASTITFTPGTGGGTNERTLRLSHLHIRRGAGVSITPGGGITVLPIGAAFAHLELDSVVIRQNEGLRGGGIALLQSGSALGGSLTMIDTTIRHNDVTGDNPYGGGLYCNGEGFSIFKAGGSVLSNSAGIDGGSNGRGGGIYLDGCTMGWFAQGPVFGEARLADNVAYGIGGGLYAVNNAEAGLFGQHLFANLSDRPLVISGNVARSSGQGGGGGVTSVSGAVVNLHATWTKDNRAELGGFADGGAARVTGGGEIRWARTIGGVECHHRQKCSLIRNNRAGDSGAIVYARGSNSSARIDQTWADYNYHTSISGSGSIIAFLHAQVDVLNSVLARAEKFDDHPNPARPTRLIHISTGGRVNLIYSTVAFHSLNTEPFLFVGLNPALFVRGSILQEPPGLALGRDNSQEEPTIDTDCTLWSDETLSQLEANGSHSRNLLSTSPGFLGPDDFRLAKGSPAIDYCNTQTYGFGPPPEFDISGRLRGVWTTPGILSGSPLYGPFDLGAFEMPVDRIFQTRFEGVPGPI